MLDARVVSEGFKVDTALKDPIESLQSILVEIAGKFVQ